MARGIFADALDQVAELILRQLARSKADWHHSLAVQRHFKALGMIQ